MYIGTWKPQLWGWNYRWNSIRRYSRDDEKSATNTGSRRQDINRNARRTICTYRRELVKSFVVRSASDYRFFVLFSARHRNPGKVTYEAKCLRKKLRSITVEKCRREPRASPTFRRGGANDSGRQSSWDKPYTQ